MNEEHKLFRDLISLVKKPENYVPRDYQTIGGMWTTDTYKVNNVTLQIMSEGYEKRLLSDGLVIYEGYRDSNDFIRFEVGGVDELRDAIWLLQQVLP